MSSDSPKPSHPPILPADEPSVGGQDQNDLVASDHTPRATSALAPATWVVPTTVDGQPRYAVDAGPIDPAQRETLQAQFTQESREVQARFAAAGVVESASLFDLVDQAGQSAHPDGGAPASAGGRVDPGAG